MSCTTSEVGATSLLIVGQPCLGASSNAATAQHADHLSLCSTAQFPECARPLRRQLNEPVPCARLFKNNAGLASLCVLDILRNSE